MIRFLKVLLLIVFTSHFVLSAGLFALSEENEPEVSHKELHIEPDRTVRLQTKAFPAWSPDGRWIAFATWDPEKGGHIYRMRSSGSRSPQRLTEKPT